MSKVYVRWYGQVLQGEAVENKEEGLLAGMVAVRIQIQGMHATALFMPDHIYESMKEALNGHEEFAPSDVKNKKFELNIDQSTYSYPTKSPGDAIADMIIAHRELRMKESVADFVQNCINLQKIENFKAENWDHEHNHLRTDKLDEFYQLWRTVMRPSSYVEAETVPQNRTPPVIQSQPKPVSSPPSKKVLRSTGKQQFNDSTQLSIFD